MIHRLMCNVSFQSLFKSSLHHKVRLSKPYSKFLYIALHVSPDNGYHQVFKKLMKSAVLPFRDSSIQCAVPSMSLCIPRRWVALPVVLCCVVSTASC